MEFFDAVNIMTTSKMFFDEANFDDDQDIDIDNDIDDELKILI